MPFCLGPWGGPKLSIPETGTASTAATLVLKSQSINLSLEKGRDGRHQIIATLLCTVTYHLAIYVRMYGEPCR